MEDQDLTDLMNAVSRTRRVDQTLTRLKLRRELSMQSFLRAYLPPIEVRTPVPEQDLK